MKILVVVGVGNVGSALLNELIDNAVFHGNYDPVLACNSRFIASCTAKSPGISWSQHLSSSGSPFNVDNLLSKISDVCDPSARVVIVDCSASEAVGCLYHTWLSSSENISIITANKTGLVASHLEDLKSLSNRKLLKFESCVGAGLPVVHTVLSMLKAGDKILEIQATLSGTLGYLFNEFMPTASSSSSSSSTKDFLAILEKAVSDGYTEPDPRDDLDGVDVARKVATLCRLLSIPCPAQDILAYSLLPAARPTDRSTEPPFAFDSPAMALLGQHMEKARSSAVENGKFLRYVSSIRAATGTVSTSLTALSPGHPLLSASGSDNICVIHSKRFPRGVVLMGAGAGAESTIHGLLCDLVSLD